MGKKPSEISSVILSPHNKLDTNKQIEPNVGQESAQGIHADLQASL